MRLTQEQKDNLRDKYIYDFYFTGNHNHVDWWIKQIESILKDIDSPIETNE